MGKRRKRPSRTRRHRESVAAKRRARAFWRMRRGYEAETVRPWRRRGLFVLLAAVAAAVIGWVATELFS